MMVKYPTPLWHFWHPRNSPGQVSVDHSVDWHGGYRIPVPPSMAFYLYRSQLGWLAVLGAVMTDAADTMADIFRLENSNTTEFLEFKTESCVVNNPMSQINLMGRTIIICFSARPIGRLRVRLFQSIPHSSNMIVLKPPFLPISTLMAIATLTYNNQQTILRKLHCSLNTRPTAMHRVSIPEASSWDDSQQLWQRQHVASA